MALVEKRCHNLEKVQGKVAKKIDQCPTALLPGKFLLTPHLYPSSRSVNCSPEVENASLHHIPCRRCSFLFVGWLLC